MARKRLRTFEPGLAWIGDIVSCASAAGGPAVPLEELLLLESLLLDLLCAGSAHTPALSSSGGVCGASGPSSCRSAQSRFHWTDAGRQITRLLMDNLASPR